MSTFTTQELPSANEQYVKNVFPGKQPLLPAKRIAVVSCMDARLDSHAITGLKEGDAHHIRNAGGRASDALRSLVISQELLGTREVYIIHHTDCGMLTFDSSTLHSLVKKRVDVAHHPLVESIAFLEFPDLEQSVKDDVEFVKRHPLLLSETQVTGFVYDVETGKLNKVAEAY